jgi:hypothetical protein
VPTNLDFGADARVVIHVAAGTHYIRRVQLSNAIAEGIRLSVSSYDALKTLPTSAGRHRSLFRPNGLIRGTERGERWWLWPMGIASPGAMRQAGHHAIAFVGRRHFDDPALFDNYFERPLGSQSSAASR